MFWRAKVVRVKYDAPMPASRYQVGVNRARNIGTACSWKAPLCPRQYETPTSGTRSKVPFSGRGSKLYSAVTRAPSQPPSANVCPPAYVLDAKHTNTDVRIF